MSNIHIGKKAEGKRRLKPWLEEEKFFDEKFTTKYFLILFYDFLSSCGQYQKHFFTHFILTMNNWAFTDGTLRVCEEEYEDWLHKDGWQQFVGIMGENDIWDLENMCERRKSDEFYEKKWFFTLRTLRALTFKALHL